jgi:7,8-dihydropterin-6-yl-methyl-4-(beta-D-ribofuranosyl)aminobenzene 5'-phosphate synthase
MKIKILYDNTTFIHGLVADWGFSCLVELDGRKILFDTGAKGAVLFQNMTKIGISALSVDEVFISHAHWDHTGGLAEFIGIKSVPVYLPQYCPEVRGAETCVRISEASNIHENIYSTGTLKDMEQSLVISHKEDVVVLVGCAHPGLDEILSAAAKFGKPTVLVGGLHGFNNFELLENLRLVCPTHCTQHINTINSRYPEKFVRGGVGQIITI